MTAQQGAPDDGRDGRWPALRGRLLAMVLRPTARPLGWGVAVAIGLIAAETLIVVNLTRIAPESTFGAIFLLGVLVVSAGWNVGLAIATSIASTLVYLSFHQDGVAAALFAFLPLALLANLLVGLARLRAAKAERRRRDADALATQQTALRHVATLVARGAEPAAIYPVAVAELARGLGVDHVTLVRFDIDDACIVLAAHDAPDRETLPVGERLSLSGDSVCSRIRRTGCAARIDDHRAAAGAIAVRMRGLGVRSGVGAPITVEDKTWGAMIVGSVLADAMPRETESRVGDFADLVATAITNAETHAELVASRARIIAAADQVRRGIERDLHDGVQQRIVALGLGLRTVEASISPDEQAVRLQLDHVINGLADLYEDIRELSRGIHPAILSTGGLGPAIRALARRSVIPVSVEVDVDRRLPEATEVAAYYVVAEALANAAKHSRASGVEVQVGLGSAALHVRVTDDGIGGATPATGGSGLIGLRDRVEAVSGHLDVTSPPDGGTTLTARIPQIQMPPPS